METASAWEVGLFGAAHITLSLFACRHILLHKEDERTAVAWIGLVVLSPFIGTFIYFLLGINRINRKATMLRQAAEIERRSGRSQQVLPFEADSLQTQLHRLGQAVHKGTFRGGNIIKPLINGDQAFPAMLKAIDEAKESIALSSYIFDRDPSGIAFADALGKAQARGVKVRVLVDGVGIRYSKPTIEPTLKRLGVETVRFIPNWQPRFFFFVNLRSHRKMLLIDGTIAFAGGMNIRDGNVIKKRPANPVQDVHFRIQGPVINQINRIFEEDWQFASGQAITLPDFPDFQKVAVHTKAQDHFPGDLHARVIPDGPDVDYRKLLWIFLGAVTCAQKRIRIVTPYFLPALPMTVALQLAAMRGVEVEIVLPENSNLPGFDWAMESILGRFLEHGAKVYRTPAPFDHSKILIVDDTWCSIGSSNWDERSFRLNFEVNLEIFDKAFCKTLDRIVDKKLKDACLVSPDSYKNFSSFRILRNNFVRLFSPYL